MMGRERNTKKSNRGKYREEIQRNGTKWER